MLSSPFQCIYAIDLQTWQSLQQSRHIQVLPNSEDADVELEVWSYNPLFTAKNGRVDCFSLYLSLRDIQDERVEIELEKMLQEQK